MCSDKLGSRHGSYLKQMMDLIFNGKNKTLPYGKEYPILKINKW